MTGHVAALRLRKPHRGDGGMVEACADYEANQLAAGARRATDDDPDWRVIPAVSAGGEPK